MCPAPRAGRRVGRVNAQRVLRRRRFVALSTQLAHDSAEGRRARSSSSSACCVVMQAKIEKETFMTSSAPAQRVSVARSEREPRTRFPPPSSVVQQQACLSWRRAVLVRSFPELFSETSHPHPSAPRPALSPPSSFPSNVKYTRTLSRQTPQPPRLSRQAGRDRRLLPCLRARSMLPTRRNTTRPTPLAAAFTH